MAVRLEKHGSVGLIVLDRPPANSYDAAMLREFASVIDDCRLDGEIRAVVVTSALEKFFSAGADLKAFQAGTPRQRWMTVLIGHEAIRKMEQTPLIFVAALTGHTMGGGLEIALGCDLRFAADGDYGIGLVETSVGLLPGNGGTQRLPRLVGLSRAIDLIASGTRLSPRQAHELGIVDRLYPDPDACRQAALEYATRIAEGASEAIGRAKVATQLGFGSPIDAGLAIEREAIGRIFVSEDAAEGINAFTERRSPRFTGR